MKLSAAILLLSAASAVAFSPSTHQPVSAKFSLNSATKTIACPPSRYSTKLSSAAVAAPSNDDPSSSTTDSATITLTKQQKRLQQIKKEGGPLAFNTKYGALNPYAIYYGLVSIGLGLVWFVALTLCQIFYKITGNKIDKKRRMPVFLGQCWGTLLMLFTGCFPKIENADIIKEFHKSGRTAMFVSNHNSWMDIPFLGHTIGWLNYKFIAKKELEKVPILGTAIKVSKNVLVDRTNRRSQLLTLKQGMKWLNDGVNLCTFPEGTRSRSGQLMTFKNGAFKMAHKVNRPVVPISICRAADVMPSYWMFPYRPARGVCSVVVHEPVESEGRTEAELAFAVREAIISGLPEDQRPLPS
mmetsp:Transcript_5483/g.9823  ORF Transcript_5483/g.9823 Transcript_5483/m.9823 type:complete len:355 (-) Transcript_5483:188-1252(-)|eukprot:CAMPEP_0201885822 /NCGR_PEP_ID=MMETSP0902-20130614/20211_1 /ASSEMBLY_ACC=CAM_ASM_000551 /TAXON_ID=420261 /ORGANISM="Thalassiosira antarctica, Strain CCMP982" /LENGTH=354 /DNA_ID=CAMNT_0048415197 /DNA_START=84 /DNA_END=1148 /DNA_ORIENTATION=+